MKNRSKELRNACVGLGGGLLVMYLLGFCFTKYHDYQQKEDKRAEILERVRDFKSNKMEAVLLALESHDPGLSRAATDVGENHDRLAEHLRKRLTYGEPITIAELNDLQSDSFGLEYDGEKMVRDTKAWIKRNEATKAAEEKTAAIRTMRVSLTQKKRELQEVQAKLAPTLNAILQKNDAIERGELLEGFKKFQAKHQAELDNVNAKLSLFE